MESTQASVQREGNSKSKNMSREDAPQVQNAEHAKAKRRERSCVDLPFGAGELKKLKDDAGIKRCSKNVPENIWRHDVVPALEKLVQQAMYYAQCEGCRTITYDHTMKAVEALTRSMPENVLPRLVHEGEGLE